MQKNKQNLYFFVERYYARVDGREIVPWVCWRFGRYHCAASAHLAAHQLCGAGILRGEGTRHKKVEIIKNFFSIILP